MISKRSERSHERHNGLRFLESLRSVATRQFFLMPCLNVAERHQRNEGYEGGLVY